MHSTHRLLVTCFDHFLPAKWIQKYLDFNNKGKWKLFIDFFLKRYDVNVLIMGNLNERDAASLEIEGRPLCQRTV